MQDENELLQAKYKEINYVKLDFAHQLKVLAREKRRLLKLVISKRDSDKINKLKEEIGTQL